MSCKIANVHRAGSLSSITVEQGTVLPEQLPDAPNVLNGSDFVVDSHDRGNEYRVVNHVRKHIETHQTIRVNRNHLDFASFLVLKDAGRSQYAFVFDRTDQDPPSAHRSTAA